MDNKTVSANEFDDEIDLSEIIGVLWAGKLKIIAITVVFAVGSLIYALSIPDEYKATVLLAPAQSEGGLSTSMGRLGGLASLAGVNIGANNTSESEIAQAIMRSRSFIETFVSRNSLAVEVYAAEGWDKKTRKLIIDTDIYDTENKKWVDGAPSDWALFKVFSGKLNVSKSRDSGLLSVSIQHYSPQMAKQWVDLYVSEINAHMQKRQVKKITNNIEYLQVQIEKTVIAEMREVFFTIIEEQIKSKMLAEASPDYAFVSVSPSMVPEQKAPSGRALICIVGTLSGAILSLLLVVGIHFAKRLRRT